MSAARLVEAFELEGIHPASKLAAIFMADSADTTIESCAFDGDAIARFSCAVSAAVLIADLITVGFLTEAAFDAETDRWQVTFPWFETFLGRRKASPKIPQFLRYQISQRDRTCVYCDCESGPFHIDHILPASRGGGDAPSNLALACAPCNISKGAKTPEEWGGHPLRPFTLARVTVIRSAA